MASARLKQLMQRVTPQLIDEQVINIINSKNFSEVLDIIIRLFQVYYIEVELVKKGKSKSQEAKTVNDSSFESPYVLIPWGEKIILAYATFIENLKLSDESEYNVIRQDAILSLYELNRQAKQHEINSRYYFTKRTLFYKRVKKELQVVLYEDVEFTESQINTIKEFFKIRNEIFTELAVVTDLFIKQLDYDAYKYSKILLTSKGEQLMAEFIVAITTNSTFIKNTDPIQIRKLIANHFGIESRNLTTAIGNLKRKKKKAQYLEELADILSAQFTYKKKK